MHSVSLIPDAPLVKLGSRRRAGFTLVELIIVTTIMLVLAAIAVMFIPNLGERQREADAGAMLQGWLSIAKTRALRDQAPRGLRLFPNASGIVVEAQYVDQPDDLFGGSFPSWVLSAPAPGTPGSTVTVNGLSGSIVQLSGLDLYNGQGPGNPQDWTVQPGDYLEVQGTGNVHLVTGVAQVAGLNFNISLASTLSYAVQSTSYFRFIRQPRVSGEERMVLPSNIGIDLNTNLPAIYNNPIVGNLNLSTQQVESYDIIFSPSGNVMGSQVAAGSPIAQGQVILWVRDYTLPPPYPVANGMQGEPTLVVVNVRSGLVAAVPVDASYFQGGSPSPYTFAANP